MYYHPLTNYYSMPHVVRYAPYKLKSSKWNGHCSEKGKFCITLHSSCTLATLRAVSCNCVKSNSSSSLGFWASGSFSCHTKQERRDTISSTFTSFKTPLNMSSVRVNSSALLISQATFPFNSTTSSLVTYLQLSPIPSILVKLFLNLILLEMPSEMRKRHTKTDDQRNQSKTVVFSKYLLYVFFGK